MRELAFMADGRSRAEWDRTAAQMALLANVNRDPKKRRPFRPEDFSPYKDEARPKPIDKESLAMLKEQFGMFKKHGGKK